jgi:hypothetical protein
MSHEAEHTKAEHSGELNPNTHEAIETHEQALGRSPVLARACRAQPHRRHRRCRRPGRRMRMPYWLVSRAATRLRSTMRALPALPQTLCTWVWKLIHKGFPNCFPNSIVIQLVFKLDCILKWVPTLLPNSQANSKKVHARFPLCNNCWTYS